MTPIKKKIVWRSDKWAWYGSVADRMVYCVKRYRDVFEAVYYRNTDGSAYRIGFFPDYRAAKAACETDAQSLKNSNADAT